MLSFATRIIRRHVSPPIEGIATDQVLLDRISALESLNRQVIRERNHFGDSVHAAQMERDNAIKDRNRALALADSRRLEASVHRRQALRYAVELHRLNAEMAGEVE